MRRTWSVSPRKLARLDSPRRWPAAFERLLPVEREALIDALERKAYYGDGAVMGLGRDVGEDVYQVRAETIPGVPRHRTAGAGHHDAGAGTHGCRVDNHGEPATSMFLDTGAVQ